MNSKEQLRNQVIQYFRSIGSGENIAQCIKEALFLQKNFNPVVLFEQISKGKQKVTRDDWRNYLVNHNVAFSQKQLSYFLNHYDLAKEATLNEFLEAMIPYNADVVRQFKEDYRDSSKIKDYQSEVDFIFTEFLFNQFKFIKAMINIRQAISHIANRKQIENMVKQFLLFNSKPRQRMQLQEQFQKRDFTLGYHQLRLFLQMGVHSANFIPGFCILNILRYLKGANPFDQIILKNRKSKSKGHQIQANAQSYQKRPQSAANKNHPLHSKFEQEQLSSYRGQRKYKDYKSKLMDEFFKNRNSNQDQQHIDWKKQEEELAYGKRRNINANGHDENNERSPQTKQIEKNKKSEKKQRDTKYQQAFSEKKEDRSHNKDKEQVKRELQNEFRYNRYDRDRKGINGQAIIALLEQIISKEERLQRLRKQLAKQNDFFLINLFKVIDKENKGYITAKNIAEFANAKPQYTNQLVNQYARQTNKMLFHQFCLIFRPLSKQLNELIDSRPQHKIPNPFKKDTMNLILQILNLSSEFHANLARTKDQIIHSGIHSLTLFQYIDLQNKGFLTADCFNKVLQENKINCDSKELKCLMRLFGKKVDQSISLHEFQQFIDN